MPRIPDWPYFKIEVEINGVVTITKLVKRENYESVLRNLILHAQCQDLPYAVFISKMLNHWSIIQPRNHKGVFIKPSSNKHYKDGKRISI